MFHPYNHPSTPLTASTHHVSQEYDLKHVSPHQSRSAKMNGRVDESDGSDSEVRRGEGSSVKLEQKREKNRVKQRNLRRQSHTTPRPISVL